MLWGSRSLPTTSVPAPRFCAAASASAFVTRPPGPVPEIFAGSRCSSSTIRLTAGERVSPSGVFLFLLFSLLLRLFLRERIEVRVLALFLFSFPALRRRASFLRIIDRRDDFADFHFLTFVGTIVSSTPAVSAAISVETLSVSRVKSASPALTKSPDFCARPKRLRWRSIRRRRGFLLRHSLAPN